VVNERKISVLDDNASEQGISIIDIYRLSLRGKLQEKAASPQMVKKINAFLQS
jgi:hypothetical protein